MFRIDLKKTKNAKLLGGDTTLLLAARMAAVGIHELTPSTLTLYRLRCAMMGYELEHSDVIGQHLGMSINGKDMNELQFAVYLANCLRREAANATGDDELMELSATIEDQMQHVVAVAYVDGVSAFDGLRFKTELVEQG